MYASAFSITQKLSDMNANLDHGIDQVLSHLKFKLRKVKYHFSIDSCNLLVIVGHGWLLDML